MGAVTGDVGVTNSRVNILTRLIGMRYWVAFNQERAAQSYFRTVLCCSGPLAAYRRAVLDKIWHQTHTRATERSHAHTATTGISRTSCSTWATTRSSYRPPTRSRTRPKTYARTSSSSSAGTRASTESSCGPFLLQRSSYIVFEVVIQTALPLLLTLAVTTAVLAAVFAEPERLVHYLEMIVVMAALRCSYAIYRTKALRSFSSSSTARPRRAADPDAHPRAADAERQQWGTRTV